MASASLLSCLWTAVCLPALASPSPIEGVWSFNGGKVAIHNEASGKFIGTVVAAARFSQCAHPVGEEMWTDIVAQPDGSFWGMHQWYFETPACAINPSLGPTAWRVMEAKGGAHFLIVCFSSPGTAQPTIAPSGTHADATFGCFESALVAPLVEVRSLNDAAVLPDARKCFSHRYFHIHLRDPRFDPLKSAVVTLANRRITVMRHGRRFTAEINLRGLPKGAFTVKIQVTTVLGHHLGGTRTYHTCVRRRAGVRRPRSHAHAGV
jgi:hypothetical protein